MSEYRPPNNRKGKKPAYHNVPVRTKTTAKTTGKSSGKQSGSKYGIPKAKKLPTPVIVTNILMIGVILAICGVVFAIAYNNIQYDKADAARSSKASSGMTSSAVSSVQKPTSSAQQSSVSSAVSSVQSSAETSADTSAPVSSVGESTPDVIPASEFDAEFFKDDLFIGDSIFTGLYLYSHIDRENVAAAIGYTAYSAQVNPFDEDFYSGSAVEYAKDKQPKHIIIMLGSNGLSTQTDFDDFENGYRGLLNTLMQDCPNSEICVISVPPITADSSMASYSGITNTIIDKANVRIKSLCSGLGLLYYDFNSVLKDENGYFSEKYAEGDGMHFLGTTYPVLLSGVQKIFE